MIIDNSTSLNTVYNSVVANDDAGELFIKLYPTSFITGGPVTATDSTGTYIRLTEADILPGTFTIDRYTQSGDTFEIGTAYAAECKFTLNNYDKKFDKVLFEGAEVQAFLRISGSDYALGKFTVDEKPRVLTNVVITALDDMVKFDVPCPYIQLFDDKTLPSAIYYVCQLCGVSYDADSITNAIPSLLKNYSISAFFNQEPTEVITYRQVLMWMLQLACVNGYIDVDGKFKIRFYSNEHSGFNAKYYTINSDVRVSADSLDERSYGVFSLSTGNFMTSQRGHYAPYVSGNVDYCLEFDFSGNPYVSLLETEYASGVYLLDYIFSERFSNFEFRPFKAKTLSFFWLEPLDRINYKEEQSSTAIVSYISHSVYRHGGFMEFEIRSESKTRSGYATANPLTATERDVLMQIRNVSHSVSQLSTRETNIIEFNKAINAGSALYSTEFNGNTYYHDKEDLYSSSYIMTVNSSGVAWTDEGWRSSLSLPGNVWKYGYTCDGNAILNSLDTYVLNAELITVNDLQAFGATIGGWHINQNAMYADVGKYRAYIQSASSGSVSDAGDSWIFSTQELVSGAYQPRFYVSAKGELFANSLITDSWLETGRGTENKYESVVHYRTVNGTTYKSTFGLRSPAGKPAVGLQLMNGNTVISSLDIYNPTAYSDEVTLRVVSQNNSDEFMHFSPSGLYLTKTESSTTGDLPLYCGTVHCGTVHCDDVKVLVNGSELSVKDALLTLGG